MIVTFCGHARIGDPEKVRLWLDETLNALEKEGATQFLLGSYGEFDRMAAEAVAALKERNRTIRSIVVLPYRNRQYEPGLYDQALYPPLNGVSPRRAIVACNYRMVDRAQVVVAYVLRAQGGAAITLRYAQERQKRIVCYPGA